MSFVRRPSSLQRGATVHVVAPAGPVDPDRLRRGIARFREAFPDCGLSLADNLDRRDGYFAGDDDVRLRALSSALADASSSVVWCARGGYGTTRILDRLDPEPMRARPKLVVGFSDATALLCWARVATDSPGIHGPVIGQLGTLDAGDLVPLRDLLRGEVPPPLEAEQGQVLGGGTVEGPLLVGNLEVLRSLIGTRFMPSFEGAIVGFEEIGERPYRVDRALTQLISSGALRGVRGVVVGQLTGCIEPDDGGSRGMTAPDVIAERLGRLGVPVVTGFPFGHDDRRNVALPFGARVRLTADDATLVFLEPVTAP